MTDEKIVAAMRSDAGFMANVKACENWPNGAYMMRPHGLKSALFLLADVASGESLPDELELRKACALVYADHLRLEGRYFYAEEAKQHKSEKANQRTPRCHEKENDDGG